jgi:hypothetical protein
MTLQETIIAINKGTINIEDVPDAKTLLENEIMACDDVIQDGETEWHMRREYQEKRKFYNRLLNRL